MRTIENQFPEFDNSREFQAMGILLGEAFTDSSWGNDACPSYWGEFDEDSGVTVFVDFHAPEQREIEGASRFTVLTMRDGVARDGRDFEDLAQCALFARLMLAAMLAARSLDLGDACRLIQDAAMQRDGGVAGVVFSGPEFESDTAWQDMAPERRLARAFEYAETEFNFSPIVAKES